MFSIITPVYNAGKYLEKCIKSVQDQTYSDWEMVLVDDGSTDSSWNIIRNYMVSDVRIRGIQQTNAGPGAARNTGIAQAVGDYAVFLDSDDYIDCNYLKLLEPKTIENDLVFIDVLQVDKNGSKLKEEKMSKYKNMTKDKVLRSTMAGKIPWGGVRKAVSLRLLREYGIQYSNLSIGEEALFSFRTLVAADSIDFLDEKPVYMYVNHEGSQSKLMVDDPWGGTVKVMKEYLIKANMYEKYANTLNALNVVATIVSIDKITGLYRGKGRMKRINCRMNEFLELNDKEYEVDIKSMSGKAMVLYPFLWAKCIYPIVLCSIIRRHMHV